ncbi:hypothetical protein ACFQ07_19735, partial [Actinomadura adrarensis]
MSYFTLTGNRPASEPGWTAHETGRTADPPHRTAPATRPEDTRHGIRRGLRYGITCARAAAPARSSGR